MIYLLPALISFTLGYLIIKVALKDRLPGLLLTLFLSATLGLGASGLLTFTSFILFNQLVPWFVIVLNLAVAGILATINKNYGDTHLIQKELSVCHRNYLILMIIPLIMYIFASLYPYGGWDAWGSWNFKARFLFLGGDQWTRMFDPVLWRHQILYPFLLPLINVWFWSFGSAPTYAVPMTMTCLIPLLTAGLLYSALKEMTSKSYMILVPLWIFTQMFIIQLSASQYSDLLVGLFLLAATTLFLLFQKTKETGYLVLMGLALGMMSFTKVEGAALCVVTLVTALFLISRDNANNGDTYQIQKTNLVHVPAIILIMTTGIAAIPLVVFLLAYAPKESGIFINGLTSVDHPASFARLMTIITYYGKEFVSPKWTGLWIALTVCLVFAGRKCVRRELWIIPIVLGTYTLIFTGTYAVNTFYEIGWWLDTSLNRIIFALIPITALWAFLALDGKQDY